jgi:hypothetical protein
MGEEVRMDDPNIAPNISHQTSDQQALHRQELHKKLGIVDHKCSALLELSSVVLALNIIPAVSGNLSSVGSKLSAVISVAFLISSLLSLFVLWIDWEPSQETLIFRTRIYRICIFLTAIGLIAIAALMLTALNLFSL